VWRAAAALADIGLLSERFSSGGTDIFDFDLPVAGQPCAASLMQQAERARVGVQEGLQRMGTPQSLQGLLR
jgi:hypothetical protein